MNPLETNKRDTNRDSSFLGTNKTKEMAVTYMFDEQASTAIESVFNELFHQVEDKYLTNSENVSDKL